MRSFAAAAFAVLAVCVTSAWAQDFPFPVERGSALPPPTEASAGQAAPPEGAGPGGIDFGQWRNADPVAYSVQFRSQVRERYTGQTNARIRAGLEANGFGCEDQAQGRLHCRIEIMQQACAIDWYVVVERPAATPVAGFDRMCLGAQ